MKVSDNIRLAKIRDNKNDRQKNRQKNAERRKLDRQKRYKRYKEKLF